MSGWVGECVCVHSFLPNLHKENSFFFSVCVAPSWNACCNTSTVLQSAHARGAACALLCLQLERRFWTSWLANTAGIEQIMKPNIPSLPCPAPAVAKAYLSSHKRCTIERLSLSHSFTPPHSFIPLWSSFCQPARVGEMPTSPQSRAKCPHPLCKWFTTSPTYTFTLGASSTPHITYSSISFISPILVPFLHFITSNCSTITPSAFCSVTHPLPSTNCLCALYVNC